MFDRSILLPALIAAGLAATTLPALAESGDHGLGRLIHQRLREGGPFFTGAEQAMRPANGMGSRPITMATPSSAPTAGA